MVASISSTCKGEMNAKSSVNSIVLNSKELNINALISTAI
jgi:hypothetical protein